MSFGLASRKEACSLPVAVNLKSSPLFSGSARRRARGSLPDPGLVVQIGPERKLQDAPVERVGQIHPTANRHLRRRASGAPKRRTSTSGVRTKRRAPAMAEGAQHEQAS